VDNITILKIQEFRGRPLRILKMRFAKGEISEEEYRRQKAVLLE